MDGDVRMARARYARPAMVMAMTLAVVGCPPTPAPEPESQAQGVQIAPLTDCPHYGAAFYPSVGSRDSVLSLSGAWSMIPEYNDCQRLTSPHNPNYRTLAATYVSDRIASLAGDVAAANPPGGPPTGIAVATLLAIHGPYEDLGLSQGANCLYLYRSAPTAPWLARMVGHFDSNCPRQLDLTTGTGMNLSVLRTDLPPGARPRVTRFEQDALGHQAIGVLCGNHWCSVTAGGFDPASVPTITIDGQFVSDMGASAGELSALIAARGDYDAQWLAPSQGPVTPTRLWAAVIPHPRLGQMDNPTLFQYWRTAAFVYIPPGQPATSVLAGYTARYGYGEGWNAIQLCNGEAGSPCTPTGPTCDKTPGSTGRWYAKVISRSGSTREFCMKRIDHATMQVPGSARWRWISADETVWTRCLNGCCELEDPT